MIFWIQENFYESKLLWEHNGLDFNFERSGPKFLQARVFLRVDPLPSGYGGGGGGGGGG